MALLACLIIGFALGIVAVLLCAATSGNDAHMGAKR